MATHHGKEGVVTIGGTTLGNATGFTVDTTHDVVEDTALGNEKAVVKKTEKIKETNEANDKE